MDGCSCQLQPGTWECSPKHSLFPGNTRNHCIHGQNTATTGHSNVGSGASKVNKDWSISQWRKTERVEIDLIWFALIYPCEGSFQGVWIPDGWVKEMDQVVSSNRTKDDGHKWKCKKQFKNKVKQTFFLSGWLNCGVFILRDFQTQLSWMLAWRPCCSWCFCGHGFRSRQSPEVPSELSYSVALWHCAQPLHGPPQRKSAAMNAFCWLLQILPSLSPPKNPQTKTGGCDLLCN